MSEHKAVRVMLGGYWVKRHGCQWLAVGRMAYRDATRAPEIHRIEATEDWTGEDAVRLREAAAVLAFACFLMSVLLLVSFA